MSVPVFRALLVLLLLTPGGAAVAQGAPPVSYRVSFEGAAHHWVEVDVTFAGLDPAPLRARMSRSSPGRYASHDFAKNVFHAAAFDGANRPLTIARPEADEWRVAGHDGTVRLVYRIFGDHADGTYMGVDTTHAHLNMPATFMWAAGLEMRPIRVTFAPPPGSNWQVGTQLFPTANAFTFTAPNLQYFMDSPTELADLRAGTFQVADRTGRPATFRVLVHGDGSQADVDALVGLVQRVVAEHVALFREFPAFEPGHYTFLLDLVPWAHADAMEHRNSTVVSIPGLSLRTEESRRVALPAISHEFFHVWNVERIRPADLEPFDFTRANVSCCLWLAEGFTEYYGALLLVRAGLSDDLSLDAVRTVVNGSGRLVRSPVEMSQYAPFADAAVANDATDRARSFISYYTYGEAIALALDLALRSRTDGARSLDDYMRALWQAYGRPADPRAGYVRRPYTLGDLRDTLAEVAQDRAFADEFFDRHVEGRQAPDYERLLAYAGFAVQPFAPGRGWVGDVALREGRGGLEVGVGRPGATSLVPFGTPLYDAGVDAGDLIVRIDGRPATMALWTSIAGRPPGDRIVLLVRRRDGQEISTPVEVRLDPRVVVAPVGALTPAQRAFRDAWLGAG
jgi:predicted metalloprotease with PDZ domain